MGTSSQPAPRVLRGRYRLVQLLGRGGMGHVWMAEDLELERRVAIKMLASVDEPSARRRFVREAKVVASFRSAHCAQVFELGWEDDQPFIAMELLEGLDLEKKITAGPLSPEAVLAVVEGCCAALEEAHHAGVVHRDIKPANIFLSRIGEREVIKLLDFGIALRGSGTASLTGEGAIIGTPSYMSPEQSQGLKVDFRTDLWSLAVVAYESLTGQHPFDAPTDWETLAAIVKRPVPAPSSLRPELSPSLDEFFLRALRRDPERRFADAATFREAFADAVAGRAPAAETPPTTRITPAPTASAETTELAVDEGTALSLPLEPTNRRYGALVAALVVMLLAGWGFTRGGDAQWASSFGSALNRLEAPAFDPPLGESTAAPPPAPAEPEAPVEPPPRTPPPAQRPAAAPRVVTEPVGRPRPVVPTPAPAENEFGI